VNHIGEKGVKEIKVQKDGIKENKFFRPCPNDDNGDYFDDDYIYFYLFIQQLQKLITD
jgi:hypothetical protein